ncbi:hypothetical protein ANCDUO_22251, partial [Ancylostoma duodenale]
YKYVKGQRLTDLDLSELYEGLKLNEINEYTHILTGTTCPYTTYGSFEHFSRSCNAVSRHWCSCVSEMVRNVTCRVSSDLSFRR